MQKVQGIIIHQITTRAGTWFRLRDKTWIYVPEAIHSLLIGCQGEFEGDRRHQKGCKPFIYARSYRIPEEFDRERVISKVMKLVEKLKFRAKNLLRIQTILGLLVYLFVIGRLTLIKKMAKWNDKKLLDYSRSPYNFYLNGHLDFLSTDMIAKALMVDEREKIYPYAHYILTEAYKNGREYLTVEELHRKIQKGLRNNIATEELLEVLKEQKKLTVSEDRVYLNHVYYMKQKCLEMLRKNNLPSLNVYKNLPEQLKSILQWRYSVLTGEAGTGKTSLVRQLKNSGLDVRFTATVGKAAKKLDETATTIHDLLGYPSFKEKKISAHVVVVDEASMLTWQLLYHILTKIEGHVIFVGDPEQTSPVQGSAVFKEVIENMPPGSVKKLETVYRTVNTKREILRLKNPDSIKKVVSLATCFEKKGYNWQILTPLKRTAHQLNLRIQYKLRGNGTDEIFRKGDRVMFLKNLRVDGELIAGNGETGYIVGRDGDYYIAKFGEKLINCLESEISLAYAITIHKATGSEYDYVICYIPAGINREEFLTEDLLLVADTRAKVKTIFICEDSYTVEKIKNYVMT